MVNVYTLGSFMVFLIPSFYKVDFTVHQFTSSSPESKITI